MSDQKKKRKKENLPLIQKAQLTLSNIFKKKKDYLQAHSNPMVKPMQKEKSKRSQKVKKDTFQGNNGENYQ